MIDLAWKEIAMALLGLGWGAVCWWCGRIQRHVDRQAGELSALRETLPHTYVLKTDNGERLQRIEDKLDRVIERMGAK